MKSPCCRAINLMSTKRIQTMKDGADPDGIYRTNSKKRIENGTNFGWDMTNEAEGYPCEKLGEDGLCTIHDTRPVGCKIFPTCEKDLDNFPDCTISFNDKGEKIGECTGCDSEVAELINAINQNKKSLALKTTENNFLMLCDMLTQTTTHAKLGFSEINQIIFSWPDPNQKIELSLQLLAIDAQAKREGGLRWWDTCKWHEDVV